LATPDRIFDRTVANLDSPKDRFFGAPHSTGKEGGHEINLHQFCRDGIILLVMYVIMRLGNL